MPIQVVIGPVDDDLVQDHFYLPIDGHLAYTKEATFEELAVLAGIFPSKTQARKNGWAGPLPEGIHIRKTKRDYVWWWYYRGEPCPESPVIC